MGCTIFAVATFGGTLSAADRHVPSTYSTIQAAVNASNAGDRVLVAPGTYNQPVVLMGKAITLLGTGGAENTIIDLNNMQASAISCVNGEGPSTIIDGFTVTRGRGTFEGNRRKGGGMFNKNSSPTVRNCIFNANTIYAYELNIDGSGAGMYNQNANPAVLNCTFSDNALVGCSGWLNGGAGMYNDGSAPYVSMCIFAGNEGNNGSGMMNINSAWPTVVNCRFIENIVPFSGGGMNCTNNSGATVINCVFNGNEAWHGAAIYLQASGLTMGNSTVCGNASGRTGGGIFALSCTSAAQVSSSIFWNDTAVAEPADHEIAYWGGQKPALVDCIVQDGFSGSGVFTFNPMFMNEAGGDLRLQEVSQAIDRGEVSVMPADVMDLDNDGNTSEGIPLDADGAGRVTGDSIDLGAFEHWPIIAACFGDIAPAGGNGVVNVDDIVSTVLSMGLCADCDADVYPAGGDGLVSVDDVIAVINAIGYCD
jgi:hypothetical protein